MSEPKPCACGHSVEEHARPPDRTGDSSCDVEGCDCISYEADEDYDVYGRVV
jgi:hypothetical protein